MVSCEKLEWGYDLESFQSKVKDTFDIIIGSDIIYSTVWEHSIVPLWKTVDILLTKSEHSVFICCYQVRTERTTQVFFGMGRKI